MAAQNSGRVEMFLAAADFATQIAFIGQTEITGDRRRYLIAASRAKEGRLRMQIPKRGHRLQKRLLLRPGAAGPFLSDEFKQHLPAPKRLNNDRAGSHSRSHAPWPRSQPLDVLSFG